MTETLSIEPDAPPAVSTGSMREQIKALATEILVREGYRGLHFDEIARRLAITRANIHYHFGRKQKLVDEVTVEYVGGVTARFRAIWTAPETTLRAKIEASTAFNRERYDRFNPAGQSGNMWSLITVLRLERKLIGEQARTALEGFGVALERDITEGVRQAVKDGHLAPNSPVKDIALQIVAIANSAGAITQDAGSFERLEQLYLGLLCIVEHAYGQGASPRTR